MKNKGLWIASLALMMAMPMQAQKFEDNFEAYHFADDSR